MPGYLTCWKESNKGKRLI